ncbi:hypothetical protein ILUMI_01452 [Ignelater luminosus]|uniref:Uncharacterized protein n=1 Tax=Ignelater luminosus TaxID=2038154 RepID=A0A8K0GHF7_IGNLU|nr:hypothetical protein ILUMI_01452 [Ignelater luminosus]
MMSNEYRFFPVTVKVNVCAEYTKNTSGLRDIMSKMSNFKPCDLEKGTYYIKNAMPDFSEFPPQMPRGQYKAVGTFTYRSYPFYVLEFYGKIKDKPIDWKKIPKRIWD